VERFESNLLLREGGLYRGRFSYAQGSWIEFSPEAQALPDNVARPFMVEGTPIDFHCHGIGSFDFSSMNPEDVAKVDELARQRGIGVIATIYFGRRSFDRFKQLIAEFQKVRRPGARVGLLGFALEGPLLSGAGGTPRTGTWRPSYEEWSTLAELGAGALAYAVLSPDELEIGSAETRRWIESLVTRGIRPALGHFRRNDPERSAAALESLLDLVEEIQGGVNAANVTTDHLFNDMPLRIKHAWRSADARKVRDAELAKILEVEWTWPKLAEQIGPVPAALLRAARDGRISLCMNFDGEHVDLALCKRVVELIGTSNMIAITDHTEVRRLLDENVVPGNTGTLLYQDAGLVAVGTQDIKRQIGNMRSIGLSERDIWQLLVFTPQRFLGLNDTGSPPTSATFVAPDGQWTGLSGAAQRV
jgi:N-acetylglucosamine-6-phosphate deacetylase